MGTSRNYKVDQVGFKSSVTDEKITVKTYNVAIYLRKSRADLELEARGEGETLFKHKKALLKLAKDNGYIVVRIFEEIVSGESLLNRPQMQELLRCVENGEYDAVLVMDIDRLGRGNMQEQGLILETFRNSDTKIITPRKIYDLNDEFDEEYSEFEAFMARKELKIINRRLQGGRVRSVGEGNYIATRPPYGWDIKQEIKSRFLVPHSEQFEVMNMIYEWYTHEDPNKRLGSDKIANRLNELGFKSYTGMNWDSPSVLTIIKNPTNIGYIKWADKLYDGKHMVYVTDEMKSRFEKAQEILKGKYHVPYQLENGITNPLAGIVRCAKCGYSMVYRPYTSQPPHIMCHNKECDCRSSKFEYVENAIVSALEEWLAQYKIEWSKHKRKDDTGTEIELRESAIVALSKEADELEKQKSRLHDFLERGIYDEETYLDRSQGLALRIQSTHESMEKAKNDLEFEKQRMKAQQNVIPMISNAIKLYKKTKDPARKNALLKSLVYKVEYRKEKHQRLDDFTIELFPKL